MTSVAAPGGGAAAEAGRLFLRAPAPPARALLTMDETSRTEVCREAQSGAAGAIAGAVEPSASIPCCCCCCRLCGCRICCSRANSSELPALRCALRERSATRTARSPSATPALPCTCRLRMPLRGARASRAVRPAPPPEAEPPWPPPIGAGAVDGRGWLRARSIALRRYSCCCLPSPTAAAVAVVASAGAGAGVDAAAEGAGAAATATRKGEDWMGFPAKVTWSKKSPGVP